MESYNEFEEPIPHWAARRSDGDYMIMGTQLCTRDGRRTGNAMVMSVVADAHLGALALCKTDAGNTLNITEGEAKEMFHKPTLILKRHPLEDNNGVL